MRIKKAAGQDPPLSTVEQQAIARNFGQWCAVRRRQMAGQPTQDVIAAKAGMSRTHYGQIELGAHGTSRESAIAIAKALGYESPEDIGAIIQLAGHGDPAALQPVITGILQLRQSGTQQVISPSFSHIGRLGQPVEIPDSQMANIIHSLRASLLHPDEAMREFSAIRQTQQATDQRIGTVELKVDRIDTTLRSLERNIQRLVELAQQNRSPA